MPILALLPFIDRNFEEKFALLRRGPGGKGGYMTVKQALEDGAVVLKYGYVMSICFTFLVCAWQRELGEYVMECTMILRY